MSSKRSNPTVVDHLLAGRLVRCLDQSAQSIDLRLSLRVVVVPGQSAVQIGQRQKHPHALRRLHPHFDRGVGAGAGEQTRQTAGQDVERSGLLLLDESYAGIQLTPIWQSLAHCR